MYGNTLDFKTFNGKTINRTDFVLPKASAEVPFDSDEKRDIPFPKPYGVAPEVLEWNENHGNVYGYHHAKKDENRKEMNYYLHGDGEHLYDTHDIVIDPYAEASYTFYYRSHGEEEKFRSTILRVHAGEGSKLTLVIIADEDEKTEALQSIGVILEKDADVKIHPFTLSDGKTMDNLKVYLDGEGANFDLRGMYFGHASSDYDFLYHIKHGAKKTTSDIKIDGALRDKAEKTMKSTLDFLEGSPESVGDESEIVTLLSDDVKNISIPALLAHEDNVVGNHAASAGKLDQSLIFYIKSRGYDEDEATELLLGSRFAHALDRIPDEDTRKALYERIRAITRGNAC